MNFGEILGLSDVLKEMAPVAREVLETNLTSPEQWLVDDTGGRHVTAGVPVNEETAMAVGVVNACVGILSGIRAMLPLKVYQKTKSGKRVAEEHRLYPLLHDEPNDEQAAFLWREAGCVHELLWGDQYSYIELDGAGRVTNLWSLDPARIYPYRDVSTHQILYHITPIHGPVLDLPAGDILHVPALGFDGLKGRSRIGFAREAIGLSIITERHGAAFFADGGRPSVALKHPGKANRKIAGNIKREWMEDHGGAGNLQRPAVLFEGMDLVNYGMPNDDAQFLGTRSWQVEDIGGRFFRIPLWLLGVNQTGHVGSGIEQQNIAFLQYSLMPDLIRVEQVINAKLFSARDRANGYFVEHAVDGLLRSDFKSRMEGYQIAVGGPFMTRDEARSRENLDRRGGPYDDVLQNLNQEVTGAPDPTETLPPANLQGAFEPLVREAWLRGLRRMGARTGHAEDPGAARSYAVDQLEPILTSYRQMGGRTDDAEYLVGQVPADALDGDLEVLAARLAASALGA
jgi:HK97 family phage portal protein